MDKIVKAGATNNELLALAEKLGIDMTVPPDLSDNAGGSYTPFVGPDKVRVLKDAHKSEYLTWDSLDDDLAELEQFYYKTEDGSSREWNNISEVGGIIVDYSQRDQLSYWDGKATQVLCSVIGYGYPEKAVKALPKDPYKNKYVWVKDVQGKSEMDTTQPSAAVSKLGLIGKRDGVPTLCETCIQSGKSTEQIVDSMGKPKKLVCEPKGRLYIVVYELTKITKRKGVKGSEPTEEKTSKQITELYRLEDDKHVPITKPFLLQIAMPRSFINGNYDTNDQTKSITGYFGYVQSLIKNSTGINDMRRMPLFNFTVISMKKKEASAPTAQTHFESMGVPAIAQIEEAKSIWTEAVPERMVASIELSTKAHAVSGSPVKMAEPAYEDLVDATPEDESPF